MQSTTPYILLVILVALVFGKPTVFAATDSTVVNLSVTGGGSSLPPPPPPPPVLLVISNVSSSPLATSTTIFWSTNIPAISTLSWGLTPDYELGTSVETSAATAHQYTITGLSPLTHYYFKIAAAASATNTAEVTGQEFVTTAVPTIPPNPRRFTVTYDPVEGDINLDWLNPTNPDFAFVRIVRSTSFYPINEGDGELVYQGRAESAEDTAVTEGVTYYYTIFARNNAGQFSSGLVGQATVPLGQEIVPPDEEPPAVDPFVDLPPGTIIPEGLRGLSLGSFEFFQRGKKIIYFGDRIPVDANENLTVSLNYDLVPEVLKTIGVTLQDPADTRNVFSFLLRIDDQFSKYRGTIGPLSKNGEYPIYISIIDHKHQSIRRFTATLVVRGGLFVNDPAVEVASRVVAPIGQTVGVLAGISQTVVLATNASSVYEVYLLIVRLFGGLLGILGIRKKSRPWGTVYDSVTKRPLDPAYVTVRTETGEVADAITDLDGRYGFLLPEGTYVLGANKTNYSFPSKTLAGKTRDELYENLYHGEPVATKQGEIIDKNIPLDPVGFDWNEFIKNKRGLFRLHTRRERIKTIVFNTFYVFGLLSTIFALLVSPSVINGLIMLLYVVLFIFQTFVRLRHTAARVVDRESGEPIPFAIVRIFLSRLNQQVKAVVADEFGRFYALVSPGSYYVTVEAKQADGSYKKMYTSPTMELPKGVLRGNLRVEPEKVNFIESAQTA